MQRTHVRQTRTQEHGQGEQKSQTGKNIGKTDEGLVTEDEDEDLEAKSIELLMYRASA
jgi:hypothetical protein